MLNTVAKTQKSKSDTLDKILQEVVLLRQELKFVLAQDVLADYKNPDKIEKSYQNAIKKYSPLCE